jgi:hypothetical protein
VNPGDSLAIDVAWRVVPEHCQSRQPIPPGCATGCAPYERNRESDSLFLAGPELHPSWVDIAPGNRWHPIPFAGLSAWGETLRANYVRAFCTPGSDAEIQERGVELNRGQGDRGRSAMCTTCLAARVIRSVSSTACPDCGPLTLRELLYVPTAARSKASSAEIRSASRAQGTRSAPRRAWLDRAVPATSGRNLDLDIVTTGAIDAVAEGHRVGGPDALVVPTRPGEVDVFLPTLEEFSIRYHPLEGRPMPTSSTT